MLMNIEAERARIGLTKSEMANTLNISLKTYYRWIRRETAIPSTYLIQMSKMFRVDIGYLLEDSDLSESRELLTR